MSLSSWTAWGIFTKLYDEVLVGLISQLKSLCAHVDEPQFILVQLKFFSDKVKEKEQRNSCAKSEFL